METITQSGYTTAAFDAFLASQSEPAWLKELRKQAWQRYLDLPWPNRGDEEWSRTDIRLFKLDKFPFPLTGDTSVPAHDGSGLLNAGVALYFLTDHYDWYRQPSWPLAVPAAGTVGLAVGLALDWRRRSARRPPDAD